MKSNFIHEIERSFHVECVLRKEPSNPVIKPFEETIVHLIII